MANVRLIVGTDVVHLGGLDMAAVGADARSRYLSEIAHMARQTVERIAREIEDERQLAALLPMRAEFAQAVSDLPPGADVAGPVVAILRRRAGLSRAELARAIRRDPVTVARWEAGHPTRCSVADVAKAADRLGVSVVALYGLVADAAGWNRDTRPVSAGRGV